MSEILEQIECENELESDKNTQELEEISETLPKTMQADEIGDDKEILENFDVQNEGKILELIATKKLESLQITNLIKLNKKDINIALARSQKLDKEQILLMLPDAVYMAVKFLLAQEATKDIKEHIISKMQEKPTIYKEILIELGVLQGVQSDS
ncbi:hypothetical protein [Campylobacter suis]|uniref:Flagellar motor switch protein FliG C-terminal domain-containing protein n=1 Tax=Campylobacter suis TaxID=2790657 RepID=A0ABM8Q6I2_9BACT|nr:hypothetical protein [Campylobacter suis]CAD7288540.1 hypothetical protein LMG8286_01386 [Campylobacter suis]